MKNIDLNLIQYAEYLQISKEGDKTVIHDIIRNKNLVLQQEELVRQCILYFLIHEKKISKNLIKVETGIKVNGLYRRTDITIYDRNAIPQLLIECKAPSQKVNQKVFNQIAMYNLPLRVPYLMVSNGSTNYICEINFEEGDYTFLEEFPTNISQSVNDDLAG